MQRKMTLFFLLVYRYCYGTTCEENNDYVFLLIKKSNEKNTMVNLQNNIRLLNRVGSKR